MPSIQNLVSNIKYLFYLIRFLTEQRSRKILYQVRSSSHKIRNLKWLSSKICDALIIFFFTFHKILIQEEAEEDIEEMNKNVNSDDEEIAILEDDDPGLDSTDNENEGKIF